MRCCQTEAPSFPQTDQTELCPQVLRGIGSAAGDNTRPAARGKGEVCGGCGTTTEEIGAI